MVPLNKWLCIVCSSSHLISVQLMRLVCYNMSCALQVTAFVSVLSLDARRQIVSWTV